MRGELPCTHMLCRAMTALFRSRTHTAHQVTALAAAVTSGDVSIVRMMLSAACVWGGGGWGDRWVGG